MRQTGTPVVRRGRRGQRFIVTLPDEMADRIRALAREGHRPLNSQFELLLQDALRQYEAVAA